MSLLHKKSNIKVSCEPKNLDAIIKSYNQLYTCYCAKLANTAAKAFADRAILLDEKKLLFEQNNTKMTWITTRFVVGTAKNMTYYDILEA